MATADSAASGQLPPDWVEKTDASSGRTYFYNRVTKETSWKPPKPAQNSGSSGAGDSSLPDGWAEKTDEATGKAYYLHKATKKTQWTRPEGSPAAMPSPGVAASSASLPEGWVEKTDKSTGKQYYYNKSTKETSWKLPMSTTDGGALQAHSAAESPTEAASVAAQEASAAGALPPGWSEKTDQSTGRTYYVNKATRETSWERPKISSESAATKSPAADALPPGWSEKMDKASGRTYYVNKSTKETSWERPRAPEASSSSQQPVTANVEAALAAASAAATAAASPADDWVERLDPKSGNPYYINTKTKETSWTKPQPTAAADTTASAAASEPVVDTLPHGWTERVDTKTGRPYYVNVETKETTWTKPSAGTGGAPTGAWDEKVDPKSGRKYYYNRNTKETSWTNPAAGGQQPQRAGGSTPPPGSQVAGVYVPPADEHALPAGWIEKVDVVTGRPYYVHIHTKQPSWVRPSIAAAKQRPANAADEYDGNDGGDTANPSNQQQREFVTTAIEGLWEKRFEPRSGTFYYFNTKTHETRWDVASTSSNIAIDVSSGDTVYIVGGHPRTQTVLKYDGGHLGWVECPAMQTPQPLDLPMAWKDADATIAVFGRRTLATADDKVDVQAIVEEYKRTWPTHGGALTIEGYVDQHHQQRLLTVKEEALTIGLPRQGDVASAPGLHVQHVSQHVGFPVRNGHAWRAVTGAMLVTGGYEDELGKHPTPQTFLVDARRHTIQLPLLQVKRASHALAIVDLSAGGHLSWYAFVIGGFDGTMKTNVVERYVLGEPYWEIVSPMRTPRAAHGAAAIDKTIFVFGGRSGYTVLSTGEYMHCQSTGWLETAPMRHARCNFGCEPIKQYVLCVGGWNGNEWLSSVEAYDIRLDTWRDVNSLPSPRGGFATLRAPFLLPALRGSAGDGAKALHGTRAKTLAETVREDLARRGAFGRK